ncbi:hypothetical protein GCM10009634_05210 [Saccharothrix xinjiangensis]
MPADRGPAVVRHPLHRPRPGFRTCRPHVPPDERSAPSGFSRAPIEDRFARLVRAEVFGRSAPDTDEPPHGSAFGSPQGSAFGLPHGSAFALPHGGSYASPHGGAFDPPHGGVFDPPHGGSFASPPRPRHPILPRPQSRSRSRPRPFPDDPTDNTVFFVSQRNHHRGAGHG